MDRFALAWGHWVTRYRAATIFLSLFLVLAVAWVAVRPGADVRGGTRSAYPMRGCRPRWLHSLHAYGVRVQTRSCSGGAKRRQQLRACRRRCAVASAQELPVIT